MITFLDAVNIMITALCYRASTVVDYGVQLLSPRGFIATCGVVILVATTICVCYYQIKYTVSCGNTDGSIHAFLRIYTWLQDWRVKHTEERLSLEQIDKTCRERLKVPVRFLNSINGLNNPHLQWLLRMFCLLKDRAVLEYGLANPHCPGESIWIRFNFGKRTWILYYFLEASGVCHKVYLREPKYCKARTSVKYEQCARFL